MTDDQQLKHYVDRVEEWLNAHPPALERDGATMTDRLAFERSLYASDLFGVWLPEAIGGRGLPTGYRVAFERGLAAHGVQDRLARIGQNLLLPSLLKFGTDEQIERHAPGIVSGETLWCQGFSEPGAGSDLAGIRTRAAVSAEGLVVNGQKIWTSGAHIADWCFAVVRTSDEPDRHGGLTFGLFPMTAQGVESRPIDQIDGNSEFSEVFLDDVHIAGRDIVGGVGNGWAVAMATLQAERSTANIGRQARFTDELVRVSALLPRDIDERVLSRMGTHWMNSYVMSAHTSTLAELDASGGELGIAGSMAKLFWSEAHQSSTRDAVEIAEGAYESGSIPAAELAEWRRLYLAARAETIYAGTSEVQRNIIARRGLGLPARPMPVISTLTSADDAPAVKELAEAIADSATIGGMLAGVAESGLAESLDDDGGVEGFALFLECLAVAGGRRVPDPFGDGIGVLLAGLSPMGALEGASSDLGGGRHPGAALLRGMLSLSRTADGVVIDGRVVGAVVPTGAEAVWALARTSSNEDHLVRVPLASVTIERPDLIGRPEYVVDLVITNAILQSDADLGEVSGDQAMTQWQLALSAVVYGAMVSAFDQALVHASTREQFGALIGSFQAVQHRLVDDYVAISSVRLMLRECLAALDRGDDARDRVDALRALLGAVGERTVESAIQVHGGLGFTREATLDILLHRVRLLARWLVSAEDSASRLARHHVDGAGAEGED